MNKITDKTTINTENNTISLNHNKSQQPQIFLFLPLKPCFVRSFFVPCSFFLRFWVPLFEGVTKQEHLRSDSGRSESRFFSPFIRPAFRKINTHSTIHIVLGDFPNKLPSKMQTKSDIIYIITCWLN